MAKLFIQRDIFVGQSDKLVRMFINVFRTDKNLKCFPMTLYGVVAGVKRLLMKLKSREIYSGIAATFSPP